MFRAVSVAFFIPLAIFTYLVWLVAEFAGLSGIHASYDFLLDARDALLPLGINLYSVCFWALVTGLLLDHAITWLLPSTPENAVRATHWIAALLYRHQRHLVEQATLVSGSSQDQLLRWLLRHPDRSSIGTSAALAGADPLLT